MVKTNDQIAGECAWCGSALNESVHGIGASFSEPLDSPEPFTRVYLAAGRTVFGAVLRRGSRAYNEGYRLIFAACSETCAEGLQQALGQEQNRFPKRTALRQAEAGG